jgi:hypothetical protein
MTISMYQASAPALLQMLNSLSVILDKAESDAVARKIDPSVLINYRLAPDMLPLISQIRIAGDFSKGCMARLAGVENPKFEDNETTLVEAKARIAKTVKFIESFKPADIEGSEVRDISLTVGGETMKFKGQTYLIHFVLPNVYFHIATAYNILRHCGLQIGKRDFMGAIP